MHAVPLLKVLADVLTLSRGVIALVLLRSGSYSDPATLVRFVVLLTLLGWTTDMCDGTLARASGKTGGRIASADFPMDILMMWSGAYVFARAQLIPRGMYIAYSVLLAVAGMLSRFNRAVLLGLCAPLAALPLVLSYAHAPRYFLMFVLWILIALTADWKRFTQVVDSFIEALPKAQRRRITEILDRLGFHHIGLYH